MKITPTFWTLVGLLISSSAWSQVTITPLAGFGGSDGWLAPGDNAFLGTGNNERGIAYSNQTSHLYLVSRTGGTSVRILDGLTGSEVGTLNTTGIAGGTFPLSKIVVDPGNGTIYGANLRTGTTVGVDPPPAGFKIYRWQDEASAPTVVFDHIPDINSRIGDNLDLLGTGAGSQIVAGYGNSPTAPNSNGYLVIDPTASASNPTLPAFNNITFTEGAGGTNDGDFRLGITYLSAPDANSGTVIGTQGTGNPRFTSYTNANDDRSDVPGVLGGTFSLTANTERAYDFIELAGSGLLATIDTSTSMVRIYDLSDPLTPVLLASLNNTTGPANANGNSAGDVRFGATGVDESGASTVNLYAMNTNNGIQAFVVTIPEPASALMLVAGLAGICVRRRRVHA